MRTAEHVTREINLIARNFECLGDKEASAATADHVRRFWAPLLRAELQSVFDTHPERFSAIARNAIVALAFPANDARDLVGDATADRCALAAALPLPAHGSHQDNDRCEEER